MSAEKAMFVYRLGERNIRDGPPIILSAGYPALPGEKWQDYGRRVARKLLFDLPRP